MVERRRHTVTGGFQKLGLGRAAFEGFRAADACLVNA